MGKGIVSARRRSRRAMPRTRSSHRRGAAPISMRQRGNSGSGSLPRPAARRLVRRRGGTGSDVRLRRRNSTRRSQPSPLPFSSMATDRASGKWLIRERLCGRISIPISDLWIDSPSAYFNKGRARIELSRPATAISLFALHLYAPEGGRGHYTSIRGGGPLTTWSILGQAREGISAFLWRFLWLNVPLFRWSLAPDDLRRIFPWMAPLPESAINISPDHSTHFRCFGACRGASGLIF